jgi:hypothetical protein
LHPFDEHGIARRRERGSSHSTSRRRRRKVKSDYR